jgi:hypothetical protein
VSLGVSELDSGAELLGRAWPGGGRKRAAGTDPGLRPALLALAAEHTAQGDKVSADMVGDLRRADGFSLQGNAKTIEGSSTRTRMPSSGTSTSTSRPTRMVVTR